MPWPVYHGGPLEGVTVAYQWQGVVDIEEPTNDLSREYYQQCLSIAGNLVEYGELRTMAQALVRSGRGTPPNTRMFLPPGLFREWATKAMERLPECFTFCENLTVEADCWVYGHHQARQAIPDAPPLHDLTELLWWLLFNCDGVSITFCIRDVCGDDRSPTATSLRRIHHRSAKGIEIRGFPSERLGKALFLGLTRGVIHAVGEVAPDLQRTVFPAGVATQLADELLSLTTRISGSQGEIVVFHGGTAKGHHFAAQLAPLADTDAMLSQDQWERGVQKRMKWVGVATSKEAKRIAVAHGLHLGETKWKLGRLLIDFGMTRADDPQSGRDRVKQISKELVDGCPCPRENVSARCFSPGDN
jgi:hypothetical protein